MAKYSVVFILALCLAQGLGYENEEYEVVSGEDRGALDDIYSRVMEVLTHALDYLKKLVGRLEKQVQEALSHFDAGKIIRDLEHRIREAVRRAISHVHPEDLKRCANATFAAVKEASQKIAEQVQGCQADFLNATAPIKAEMDEVVRKAVAVDQDITDVVLDCLKENVGHAGDTVKCLLAAKDNVTAEASALKDEITKVREDVKKVFGEARGNMVSCVGAVAKSTNAETKAIVQQFRECVHPTTTTVAPTTIPSTM